MRSDLVKCGERVDDLQNGLFVIQDPKKFCFGMDAVLLSGFARVKRGEVAIVEGDIKEAAGIFGAASFDVVTCNPPYMIGQHGLTNPHVPKAIARHEILCTFDDVACQAARVLKDRGRFFLVHRPFRLVELMATLTKYKLEPKRMQLVYPFIDKEPNMVLIEACKGGNSRIQVERPLVVYERPGVYTEDILELYRMV